MYLPKRKFLPYLLGIAVLTAALLAPSGVGAATANWTCSGTGWWDNASCWDTGIVPVASSGVKIPNSGTSDVTVNFRNSSGSNIGILMLDATGAGEAILNISRDSLTTEYDYIGFSGLTYWFIPGFGSIPPSLGGTGTVNQSGGTHTVNRGLRLGKDKLASGTYNLSGGSLIARTEEIGAGGSGIFNQTGGTNTLAYDITDLGSGELYVSRSHNSGAYNLSGTGVLSAHNEYIGYAGTGTFTQTGGSNTVGGLLSLAHVVPGTHGGTFGTYDLNAGTLFAGQEWIGSGGTGVFNQTGGTHTVVGDITLGRYGAASSGTINLSGGTFDVGGDILNGFSTGTLNIDGGTLTLGGGTSGKIRVSHFTLGNEAGSNGSYTLNNGQSVKASSTQYIGNNGTGTLTQTGGYNSAWDGTNFSSILYIGGGVTGNGTYNFNDGYLDANYLNIGQAGTGILNQSGGRNTVTNGLILGVVTSGNGTYALGGGTLEAANEVIGAYGTGAFTQSGASTNTVTNTLYVGLNDGGTGTYTLNGGDLVANKEYIGYNGTGTFNQNGGTNTVATTVTIGANSGSIGAYNLAGGTLSAVKVINNGTFNQTGGTLNAALTNNSGASFNIAGSGINTFTGNVVNHGTFSVTNSTVQFNANYREYGAFISDPSEVYFNNLIVESTGYLVGGAGDKFFISGNYTNNSSQYSLWNTADSYIGFTGTAAHAMSIAGSPLASNFSFGTIEVLNGGSLNLTGSNFYINNLVLSAGSTINLGGINLYYTSLTNYGGTYLGGQLIQVADVSQVPEPGTILLMATGLTGLMGLRKRLKGIAA